MSNLFVFVGRSEPRDLMLGSAILKVYRQELLGVWWVCLRATWLDGGASLSTYRCGGFGWGGGG
jgi:hypothetical protein